MNHDLLGKKVAVLAASGFCEQDMSVILRALRSAGGDAKIVSSESGLLTSWEGSSWGHSFAVDVALNTALGADFDMIVIPSGYRSHDKLKSTAHTRRFIKSFIESEKPVCVIGDALSVIEFCEVPMPDTSDDVEIMFENNMMFGMANDENREGYIQQMVSFFASSQIGYQSAA